ncbi:MAG: PilZ domain-containing protein [Deltaproteobacteria bacterium]|nr:PilZ domain-containing protein [Deltaproteobacteria bacterium]
MTKTDKVDKRKHPRIDFHLDISLRGRKGPQQIRNFSLYGVFLRTRNPTQYHVGDRIRVVMKLPNEEHDMEVNGRVAHVSERGIGVEFLDLAVQDAVAMEFCFHVFKHTTPLPGT